jgi:hypothetical protein
MTELNSSKRLNLSTSIPQPPYQKSKNLLNKDQYQTRAKKTFPGIIRLRNFENKIYLGKIHSNLEVSDK